jgi:hypothetical protein
MASPRVLAAALLAIAVAFLHPAQAQTAADIAKALNDTFVLAKTNPTRTDLTAAGSILILKKDRLLMNKSSHPVIVGNLYKDGKIRPDGFIAFTQTMQAALPNGAAHYYMPGDKFFVTSIQVRPDSVSMEFMTDFRQVQDEDDQRFRGSLKFPFPKGQIPNADDLLAQISEVVQIDAGGGGDQDQGQGQQDQTPPPPPAPRGHRPPPAPAQAPAQVDISLGMTRDQVIAALGAPTSVAHLGLKEVDVFPNMKVIFINGRVVDVQ